MNSATYYQKKYNKELDDMREVFHLEGEKEEN